MKNLLLAGVSAICLVSVAQAADLPVRVSAPAPYAVPVAQTWTGLYFGGSVGLSAHNSGADLYEVWDDEGYGDEYNGPQRLSSTGAAVGIYGGYNWQVGRGVFGVEADVSFHTNRANDSFMHVDSYEFGSLNSKLTTFSSLRARAGVDLGGTLAYVTGGVAFANQKQSYVAADKGIHFKRDDWKAGWVVGAGLEHMLMSSVIVRAEVLYAGLGSKSVSDSGDYFDSDVRARFKDNNVVIGRIGAAVKF